MDVFAAAAKDIATAIRSVLSEKDICTIGIVGGRSAPGILEALTKESVHGNLEVFWLDERVKDEKNYSGVVSILKKLGAVTHPFVSTDKQGIIEEIGTVESRLEALGNAFDIVIVSAGEDGHICSLFPNHPALTVNDKRWVFVDDAPKPPPARISVTIPLLLTAQHAFLFFVGKEKKPAYDRFLQKGVSREECPAKVVSDIKDSKVYVQFS